MGLSCGPWHGLYGACIVTCGSGTKEFPTGNSRSWFFYHLVFLPRQLLFTNPRVSTLEKDHFYPLVYGQCQPELDLLPSFLPAHASLTHQSLGHD